MSVKTETSVASPPYSVRDGLVTLDAELLAVREALERTILGWSADIGARSMLFPPLMRSSDLSRFDFFRNFPHLAWVVSPIRQEALNGHCQHEGDLEAVPAADLESGRYVLPSAACYNVYLHFENQRLEEPQYVTTVATCFRHETHYEDLRRLCGFSMREIVCLGTADDVKAHLRRFKERIVQLVERLDLKLKIETATDPFYQPQSSVARLQKLFPQKEEFVYGDSLAIASLNFHRNFFGERCNILQSDGEHAFSGCVAFGLERWFYALLDRYQGDTARILQALD